MDKVSVDLANCYGIKKLQYTFDFAKHRAYAIYAPNGAMKSSLAQTFQDLANGAASVDRLFPNRASTRTISDETGAALKASSILVVRPYDEAFGHTEKTSTLLVDAKLRKEYEELYSKIDEAKEALLAALKELTGSKRSIEKEIANAFSADDFYTALYRIRKEVEEQTETPFADVPYDKIFDETVLSALGTQDVATALQDYITRYNELLAASTFFKKGVFDYYNAGQIAKTLAKNGFFEASHTVHLNADQPIEIHSQKELEAVIATEKDAILKDKQLRKKFDELAKMLEKNETLRTFQSYLLEHSALLAQFSNVTKFKQDVWKSCLKTKFELYRDLLVKHDAAQKRQKEIEAEAARQKTQWEEVIRIFRERFVVPYKLEVTNRIAVMLGNAPIMDLSFTYHDGAEKVPVKRDELLSCLSVGEKRALYILNVIFEVEVRKKAKQETLMVIDDIADSFDYQNKYAIIQYLKDIHDDQNFRQVIMTHNFDFFRTLESRFVPYAQCLMASKDAVAITLEKAVGIRNVFVNDWKKEFFTNRKKKIASIPFLRNLVEFTTGETDPSFATLTSLLHRKVDSIKITDSQLEAVYDAICGTKLASTTKSKPVVEIIQEEAQACLKATDNTLESKIVLAIAIRLLAESFMGAKISDDTFVEGIASHQTERMLARFKTDFAGDIAAIEVLDRVQLMTPENIHLNSFMYEPIVDMSGDHLRKLYGDVAALFAGLKNQ